MSSYREVRYKFHKWRYEAGILKKTSLIFVVAGFTGLAAQLRIELPFTPVPITAQVFMVLFSAIILGRYGGASQAVYVSLGAAGVPWFSGYMGGVSRILGVTGGYILGFVVAAALIGWLVDRYVGVRTLKMQMLLMTLGIGIIYALGALQLSLILRTDLAETLALAVVPFIPLDIVKALAVAAVAAVWLPKQSYNGEIDADRWRKRYRQE
ncbi:MAG: biotin transporter BioY [Candidatus Bathyarchaeia archaeon]